ncbi:hypothetical protein J2W83_004832 [Pseudomonas hunanensis]|uniref:Uncharacterized protein n=1 Tax=Pseudomonas hunanensis TaxID=1247546 RepID=A0ACC6K9Y6_9PSED|nr:hypothetical protein [Pseudomonas hunanensis]MDR6715192.1 hypothetical protein [Pseudomonas hunanensis]
MKALRTVALMLCLAPLALSSGMLQAAQPAPKAEPAKSVSAKPAGKPTPAPAKKPDSKAAVHSKAKPKPKPKAKPKAVSKAVAQPLPKPKLDLSLPADMVDDLEPDVDALSPRRKPLLPAMFPQNPLPDDSPFQLNGRLISNEMQLQLRNDSRRDVEGAAIDFEFRQ